MNESVIVVLDVVGFSLYWVKDSDLLKARARFKRLSGKFPSSKAVIVGLVGESSLIDAVWCDDIGIIHGDKSLLKVDIQNVSKCK